MSPPAKKRKTGYGVKICSHLKQNDYSFCLASPGGLMVPSISELKDYCLSGNSEDCPVRKGAVT